MNFIEIEVELVGKTQNATAEARSNKNVWGVFPWLLKNQLAVNIVCKRAQYTCDITYIKVDFNYFPYISGA